MKTTASINLARRTAGWMVVAALGVVFAGTAPPARGQFVDSGFSSRYELSENIQLDEADRNVRSYLARVDEYLADGQYDEAVKTIRQVMEESPDKLLPVTDRRWANVRTVCQLRLAGFPSEALALYRRRVDPLAEQWFRQGRAARDQAMLEKVVERALVSTWGDDAMAALAEIALESGDYTTARSLWERILPFDPPPQTKRTWLSYPDTDLDPATIRSRLVLVSILEGSIDRARRELAALKRLHPAARGRLGGRKVDLAETLGELIEQSGQWPGPQPGPDWPTFAGSFDRQAVAPAPAEVGRVVWRRALRPTIPGGPVLVPGVPPARVAEDALAPLSYHPVVDGNLVLVNNQEEILGFDARTGRPAWGSGDGVIYRDAFGEAAAASTPPADNLGVPRFTMAIIDRRLYARMGSSLTGQPRPPKPAGGTGYLVCLDLESEGRLVWKTTPEEGWTLEGSPVGDGTNVYVVARRNDIRPQLHVACFDAQTGHLRWRRFVCAADTPGQGLFHETTHTLLTLHRGTLYLNTNLGVVAALSTSDGALRWASLYPRRRRGDLLKPEKFRCRDLTPCLYYRGTLLVAPGDSRRIFALAADNGQILWQTSPQLEDVVHLLGVVDNRLIAGGDRLYWINLGPERPGSVEWYWPMGHERLGLGRGILAGSDVWWPTRERIYLFDQRTGRMRREIQLLPRGATGGNLVVAAGRLLIVGADEMVAFGDGSEPARNVKQALARRDR